MADGDTELEGKLAEVRRAYVEKLPERIREIQALLETMGMRNTAVLPTLHRQIHSLTGSLGTFGFHDLSVQARHLEGQLKAALNKETSLDETMLGQLRSGIQDLGLGIGDLGSEADAHAVASSNGEASRVFVLDVASGVARELMEQVANFGYQCQAFENPESLLGAMARGWPDVLITRLSANNRVRMVHLQALDTIHSEWKGRMPPLILLGDDTGIGTRLAAVRAGAVGFLSYPTSINELIDRLDTITHKVHAVPYRVLIVDDDADLGMHYTLLLHKVGIEAQHLGNPLDLLTTIDEFKPELILMDLYMPECTGIELAKVIRQDNAYLGIPVIFLSSETSTGLQFHALSQGADGFLTKPINDEDLINSVIVRSERTRAVSSHLARDSLTGLLNHSTSKDMVSTEFQRSCRSGEPLICVMLDLDHFKAVNDTYGHMVGDQVIATLARILQQRLRETDIVGRYGGEEFIVLMPNTSADAAYHVVNELRERFGKLTHHAGKREFTVSLSAGIGESRHYSSADAMINAADEALYLAKAGGRDQIRIAVGEQASEEVAPQK